MATTSCTTQSEPEVQFPLSTRSKTSPPPRRHERPQPRPPPGSLDLDRRSVYFQQARPRGRLLRCLGGFGRRRGTPGSHSFPFSTHERALTGVSWLRRRFPRRRGRSLGRRATMSGSESWSVSSPTCPSGSCSGLEPTGHSRRGPLLPPLLRRRLAGRARGGPA